MMAFKKYLRNPMKDTARSMNEFIKKAHEDKAKSINIIIDHSILDTRIKPPKGEENQAGITYEAILPYKRSVEFHERKNDMDQLETIVYVHDKAELLQAEFPRKSIKMTTLYNKDITREYNMMLEFAKLILSQK